MSPGLLRARKQYLLQNVVTGVLVTAFVAGVYAYSINAVKQDVFDDIDEEAKALGAIPPSHHSQTSTTVPLQSKTTATPVTSQGAPRSPGRNPNAHPKGVVAAYLDRHYPQALDPTRKTLVWGAPPLDNIGKIGGR